MMLNGSLAALTGRIAKQNFLFFRLMYMYLNYGVIAEVTYIEEHNVI
jgi:hypothetical protein